MNFAEEAGDAFDEVCSEGVPTEFRLTNDPHSGVARSASSLSALREPGIEGIDEIVIRCPVVQFTRPPSADKRETVTIPAGPFAGVYTLVAVNASLAFYTLTCHPAQ